MIRTSTFHTPDAAAAFFNAPANSHLRLVSVLPQGPNYTALYETPPDPSAELEAERLRLLEERVLALIGLDDDGKRKLNFPKGAILDGLSAPVSILSNKLSHMAAYKDLDNHRRAAWITAAAAAVGCAYVTADEAKERYGCKVELVRLLED